MKVEIEAIKTKKPKLIFVFSNNDELSDSARVRKRICEKLVNEFKYNYLYFQNCVKYEILNVFYF